ncbi:MAG: envelope integrity protein Cei [Actinophytocola sp.]|uniref:envelope integrity protein Cei n=1 Tax=Actinophytocola sp. TaxID=1872138 RepID=UPI00132BB0A8|nr:envelope integrity protein Cei [Actinophytocola sp.]MPZ86118.1 envelope integrity protein Cei [Actinophytocola sp.]
MASGNVWRDNRPQRYRKRRPLPALILILILCVAATIVWLQVMDTDETTNAVYCDPPNVKASGTAKPSTPPTPSTPPATLGQALEPDSLDRTVPSPPGQVLVKVVNASGSRGAARIVTENLRQLGFAKVAEPANDPLYSDSMTCRAQIRFGPQGTSAARTLSLIEPCAQLVRDDRKDATVDIAIGGDFDSLHPNAQSRSVLERLTAWAAEHPETKGGLQANGPQPDVDAKLLTAARNVHC